MKKGQVARIAISFILALAVTFIMWTIFADNAGKIDENLDLLYDCGNGLLAMAVAPGDDNPTTGMCFTGKDCGVTHKPGYDLEASGAGQVSNLRSCDELVPLGFLPGEKDSFGGDANNPKYFCAKDPRSNVEYVYSGEKGCSAPVPVCCLRISEVDAPTQP